MLSQVKRVLTSALCIVMITALSGCASSSSSLPQHVDMKSIAFAIPLYSLSSANKSESRMALVKTDGSVSVYQGSAMFMLRASWTRAGLYWADTSDDYFISSSGEVKDTPHSKTDFQYDSIPLADGSRIATYHTGLQDKIAGRAILTKPDGRFTTLKFFYPPSGANAAIADCGDTIYLQTGDDNSMGERLPWMEMIPGPHLSIQPSIAFDAKDIHLNEHVEAKLGGRPKYRDLYDASDELYCSTDHVLHGLANLTRTVEAPSVELLFLSSFDMKKKNQAYKPIVDENGKYFEATDNYFMTSHEGFDADGFPFINGDTGAFYYVNTQTGIATKLESPDNGDRAIRRSLVATPTRYYVSSIPINSRAGKHSTVSIYSRKTHKKIRTFAISDDFTRMQQVDPIQPSKMVVNPTEPLFNK